MKAKNSVGKFYRKLKLMLYKNMFKKIEKEEDLSSSEYFCLECIYLMDKPTITQFANFLDVSAPNATYKVKQLIKKGFLSKERSEKDKREFILVPTQKFFDYYDSKEESVLVNDLKKSLDKKESKMVDKLVKSLSE